MVQWKKAGLEGNYYWRPHILTEPWLWEEGPKFRAQAIQKDALSSQVKRRVLCQPDVTPRSPTGRCGGATYLNVGSRCATAFEEGGCAWRSQFFAKTRRNGGDWKETRWKKSKMFGKDFVSWNISGMKIVKVLLTWDFGGGVCWDWTSLWVGLTIFHTESSKWSEEMSNVGSWEPDIFV